MNLTPTPVTAALAGMFSGLIWPVIWPLSTLWLMLGTIVLVALPAHAFVVGFQRPQVVDAAAMDSALLVRVGTWLVCAASAAALVSMLRMST